MQRPPLTIRRFCRRFWLITRSTFVHPFCDGFIDDMPDGSMRGRDVGRDGIEVVEARPWIGDLIAGAVLLAMVGTMAMMLVVGGAR